jgi:uncharacterized protein
MKRPPHPSTAEMLTASPYDRRAFLKRSAFTLATGALSLARPARGQDGKVPMIDTNVYLGPCPFRRLPLETLLEKPESLTRFATVAAQHSVASWAGSFESLLQRDFDGINDRLAAMVAADKSASRQFQLFGAINPKIAGWRETLRRIDQQHRMRGIRLHPNFHGYALDDSDFVALLDAASQRDLIVQIALRMEDARTQHPAVTVADVDPKPLLELLPQMTGLRLQLLNAMRSLSDSLLLARLSELGVHFDTAMLEGMSGIARIVELVPEIKLCHGSYAPFFYPEAAVLKMAESAPDLDARTLAAIGSHHAENLLTRA